MVSRHWLYFSGFVVAGVLLVVAGLLGLVEGLSALTGASAGGEFALLAMLRAAIEWVIVMFVLGIVAVVFLVATVVSVLRNVSFPRDDRLAAIVERLEQRYPVLRRFDVSDKVEPTTEDRQQRLRERYVEGEIGEAEFERKIEQLMDEASSDGASRSGNEATVELDDSSR